MEMITEPRILKTRCPALLAWRLVCVSCLLSWFIKHSLCWKIFWREGVSVVQGYELFPAWLQTWQVASTAYLLPGILILSLFSLSRQILVLSGFLLSFCAAVLLVHIQTYNDATYTTNLWAGLWLCWCGSLVDRGSAADWVHARRLAQGIVALCFLGGAVGKLTPEYWNGEAFYQIYFKFRAYFPFMELRERLTPDELRSLATVFSRVVICTELLLGTLVFWPARLSALLCLPVMLGMVMISQYQLFSVLGALFGLIIAAVIFDEELRKNRL
jgi:hypothetical protein